MRSRSRKFPAYSFEHSLCSDFRQGWFGEVALQINFRVGHPWRSGGDARGLVASADRRPEDQVAAVTATEKRDAPRIKRGVVSSESEGCDHIVLFGAEDGPIPESDRQYRPACLIQHVHRGTLGFPFRGRGEGPNKVEIPPALAAMDRDHRGEGAWARGQAENCLERRLVA